MSTGPTLTTWGKGASVNAAAFNTKVNSNYGVPLVYSNGGTVTAASYNQTVSNNWNTSMEGYRQLAVSNPEIFGGAPVDPHPPGPALTYDSKELVYNVGCVQDAYFSDNPGFFNEMSTTKPGNVSDRPTVITNMEELWKKAGTNKGMISLFIPKNPNTSGVDSIVPTTDNPLQPFEHNRYAFQFHYNPSTIKMDYAGAPNTDVGLQTSGNEGFNLVGAQVNQSTITVDIVLNRVADMKYFDEKGNLNADAKRRKVYSPRMPKNSTEGMPNKLTEEQEIFNKGTMYDLEFLLSTVIGYRLNTAFRGVTADVGWISGRPVELNLGKSLRYLGFINAFNVEHKMFNERMVPIFTLATLSFNRIPDYSGI